jgi:DNA uptake protein ComE-like DNA-binding protein
MFVRTKVLRACAAVLALVLVVPGAAAAAGPNQTGSTQTHMSVSADLDLEDPEAAIGDPVADVDVLDRNCTGDQVDVNTATVEEISERFELDSSPTVERIVEGRPWLTPGDLVSVPGVPPVLEPTLVTDGCATPLTVPEPAPSACTSSEQVDLQVASVNEIRRELRVPRVRSSPPGPEVSASMCSTVSEPRTRCASPRSPRPTTVSTTASCTPTPAAWSPPARTPTTPSSCRPERSRGTRSPR